MIDRRWNSIYTQIESLFSKNILIPYCSCISIINFVLSLRKVIIMDEKNLAILRKLKEQLLAAEPKPEVIYPFKSSSPNNTTTGRKQLYIHDEKMMQNNQIKTNVKKCVKSNTQSREENAHLDKKKKEKTTEKKEYYRSFRYTGYLLWHPVKNQIRPRFTGSRLRKAIGQLTGLLRPKMRKNPWK